MIPCGFSLLFLQLSSLPCAAWRRIQFTDRRSARVGHCICRTAILPRETREHRAHFAETLSHEGQRHSWKFGGDALLTTIYNFFPSTFGGEFIFYPINVDPFTFQPLLGGLELTPLRAYAHQVPHYYFQRFGP